MRVGDEGDGVRELVGAEQMVRHELGKRSRSESTWRRA